MVSGANSVSSVLASSSTLEHAVARRAVTRRKAETRVTTPRLGRTSRCAADVECAEDPPLVRYRARVVWIGIVLVLSIGFAVLRGGKLSNLTEIYIRAWWLLFVGLGLQIAAGFVPSGRTYSVELAVGLILASLLPLLLVAWINRERSGMWLVGLGVLMNFVVIAINQGMPVLPEAILLAGGVADLSSDPTHTVLDTSTLLPFLADIIPIPKNVISMGDVVLGVGVGVFLDDQLTQPLRFFRHRIEAEPGSATTHLRKIEGGRS